MSEILLRAHDYPEYRAMPRRAEVRRPSVTVRAPDPPRPTPQTLAAVPKAETLAPFPQGPLVDPTFWRPYPTQAAICGKPLPNMTITRGRR